MALKQVLASPEETIRLAELLGNAKRTDFVIAQGKPLVMGLTLDGVAVIVLLTINQHTLNVEVFRKNDSLDPFGKPITIRQITKETIYPEVW